MSFLRPWKNWSTHVSVVFNERLCRAVFCVTGVLLYYQYTTKCPSKLVFLKGISRTVFNGIANLPPPPNGTACMQSTNKHHQNKTAQEGVVVVVRGWPHLGRAASFKLHHNTIEIKK